MELPDFDALWDYSQPAATEQKFLDILGGIVQADHLPYSLKLLTQIARAQGLQRRFDDAHRTLDMVEPHVSVHLDPLVEIRYLLERGRVYNSSGAPEKSREYFEQAWDKARIAHEDFYAVDAAHMLAIIETPENQQAWNLKALDVVEQTTQPRARNWAGSLYNNIGWTYHDAGEYEKALEMFGKALQWRERQGKDREIRMAMWVVGRTMRSLGRIDEALGIQRRLLEAWEKAGEASGYVYEELAECYTLMMNPPQAKKYFALAYSELSKDDWLIANESDRMERLKRMSEMDADALQHASFWNPENVGKWKKILPEQFLNMLGHENRHMAVIVAYADLLRNDDTLRSSHLDDKSLAETLDNILGAATRLLQVMDVIRAYNRIHSGE